MVGSMTILLMVLKEEDLQRARSLTTMEVVSEQGPKTISNVKARYAGRESLIENAVKAKKIHKAL
jgi:hypothetical protein